MLWRASIHHTIPHCNRHDSSLSYRMTEVGGPVPSLCRYLSAAHISNTFSLSRLSTRGNDALCVNTAHAAPRHQETAMRLYFDSSFMLAAKQRTGRGGAQTAPAERPLHPAITQGSSRHGVVLRQDEETVCCSQFRPQHQLPA